MGPFRSAWALVREYRRAYLLLNLAFYGLMVAAMVYVAFNPDLQKTVWDEVGEAFRTGPLTSGVTEAYSGGQVLLAAALTFAVNLVLGSFATIDHRQGYWEGMKRSARIYVLVAITLFVAAVYEAVSMIFIMQGTS